ncbi:Cytochrome P450 [Mycena venus]|uniref:Cytochrome P450 n=1 Tax=Mycena venus TaxID=2733690 RepID=A0A8H6YBN4_9AGAR|nr:Cytochrome P450 [Mycena venus]
MDHTIQYGTAAAGVISILAVYLALRRRSTVRNIPGPVSPSWLFGNMLQLYLPSTYGDYEFDWQRIYGPFYRIKGCFGQDKLMISDPVSLQYILNSPHFKFGPTVENAIHVLYGTDSIMGVNEEDHKRIRAALNVGYTAAAVRDYIPVFEKAAQTLTEQLEESSGKSINICPRLSLATLSTISEVVMGYSTTELGEEFIKNNFQACNLRSAIASSQSAGQIVADAIGARLPGWVWRAAIHLPTATCKAIRTAKRLANELGNQVLREKREAAEQGLDINTDLYGQLLDLHLLDKTKNTLTEAEIVAQTAITMIAGQDTTANTLTFGLVELAKSPEFQDRLRAEIHSTLRASDGGSVSYDNMPLLNAFIKESLRMFPAEAVTDRVAVEDVVIPLTDNLITTTGERISHIPVSKGQIVTLAIASYQRLESRWGEDAQEFKPSRWLDGPTFKGEAVGPYANLLSFLGGPRVCLGWRFAIMEMQVFVCELVGKFAFTLSEGDSTRPRLASSLLPTMSDGQKGALICAKRVM